MSKHKKSWTPTDHPPHQWPRGQAASWRDGHGCPTIWCKGDGTQREEGNHPEPRHRATTPPAQP